MGVSKIDKILRKHHKPLLPERNWRYLVFISLFLGLLGADRFYMGRYKTGWIKLLTFGGFGFWWIYDLFKVYNNEMEDDHGMRAVKYYY